MNVMGIDLGGSGFRAGVFDTESGQLIGSLIRHNHRYSTEPEVVLDAIIAAVKGANWKGPIGLGFPGAIESNRPTTAPNLGEAWIGYDVKEHLGSVHDGCLAMVNDADAVAIAEKHHGAGHQQASCVLTLTVGTGLGTTVHKNGQLIPNLEYGRWPHPSRGGLLEQHLSGAVRTEENLSLEAWAERFQEGLEHLEASIQPDRIVLYGGIMEHWPRIEPLLRTKATLVASKLSETAGPLGAAIVAAEAHDAL